MNDIRRQKGFSLVELILAIAAFSILSGFILQMFLTAAHVNLQAAEYDQGTLLCERAIETALAQCTPRDAEQYFNAQWEETDKELATYALTLDAEPLGEALIMPRRLDGAGDAVSRTQKWELAASMARVDSGETLCALTTRQVVQAPEEVIGQ